MTDRPTPEQALATVAETVYPLDVFPPPPLPLVAQVLKDAGLTLDALTAEIARQMLYRVARMGVDALAEHDYVIVDAERLAWLERIEAAAEQMPIDLDDWIADE